MSKKEVRLKTKRLVIEPMSKEEMEQLISDTDNAEIKAAFQEMLNNSIEHPEDRLWHVIWKICLKENGQKIGEASFKGGVQDYSVEIGYGIDDDYQGKGYMTEAAKEMIAWAFTVQNVYFVEAETDENNIASKKVLEKLAFKPDGVGEEGPRFVLEKPTTQWMPIYMLFGISIGTALGTTHQNIGIGMSMGMCIGLAIGAMMDSSEKSKLKKITEERNKNKEV